MVPDQVGDDNVEVGGSVSLLLTTLSFRYLISFVFRFGIRWDVREDGVRLRRNRK